MLISGHECAATVQVDLCQGARSVNVRTNPCLPVRFILSYLGQLARNHADQFKEVFGEVLGSPFLRKN
jgi:hypothetical protein